MTYNFLYENEQFFVINYIFLYENEQIFAGTFGSTSGFEALFFKIII